jgi:hypothetical protein
MEDSLFATLLLPVALADHDEPRDVDTALSITMTAISSSPPRR